MVRSRRSDIEQDANIEGFVALILEHWRSLFLTVVAAVFLSGFAMWSLIPREYEARMTLATVTSSRMSQLPSGLAALSGLTGLESLRLTPELIAWLATSRRVLLEVARSPMPGDSNTLLADRVTGGSMEDATPRKLERAIRDLLDVSVDRRVGLLTISVIHRDTALARLVLDRVVSATSRAFSETARAQATEQRKGQDARVQATATQLARAESALVDFASANRLVTDYSPAMVERQRLERLIQVAQQSYMQAATEREEAVARELEQTPALVAVDSPPSVLPRAPRFIAIRGVTAGIAAGFILLVVIVLREGLRRRYEAGGSEQRLVSAVRDVPILRWILLGRNANHVSRQDERDLSPRPHGGVSSAVKGG
jgi:uncharacterized protein involved in exopolysaccharide biosynthesis